MATPDMRSTSACIRMASHLPRAVGQATPLRKPAPPTLNERGAVPHDRGVPCRRPSSTGWGSAATAGNGGVAAVGRDDDADVADGHASESGDALDSNPGCPQRREVVVDWVGGDERLTAPIGALPGGSSRGRPVRRSARGAAAPVLACVALVPWTRRRPAWLQSRVTRVRPRSARRAARSCASRCVAYECRGSCSWASGALA